MIQYNFLLEFVSIYTHSSSLQRVLDSLSNAMAEGRNICDEAKTGGENYYDMVCDSEADVAEDLAGAAFVVAQAMITGIVSSIMRLHRAAKEDGVHIAGIDGKREEIMLLGSPLLTGSNFSRIQVINAFANYFKHHDEWVQPWSGMQGLALKTSQIVVAAGARESTTGNLRTGLKALDVDFDRLDRLHDEISKWGKSVQEIYHAELTAAGLL